MVAVLECRCAWGRFLIGEMLYVCDQHIQYQEWGHILKLLGTAHINAINGYVEVPELDTHVFVTHGMSHVIAVSAAAIEHALTMFTKNDLKVKQVLASTSKGKLGIKLLKVLNKTTGKMTNAPFLFSAARWAKVTASFIKSLSNKPPVYVEATVQMARACTALNDTTDMPQSLLDNEESDDDERAMLCKIFFIQVVVSA
ncbi:hypothetical protein F4604DRAFT_1684237 [Suillus subluteus]|nr:hypothetical protein F4604DRAFT_1684237 [Suillus subluteus]